MRHNLSLSTEVFPWFRTRLRVWKSLQFEFSWRCCLLLDKQVTLPDLARRAGGVPCVGRLTQKYPKKGRNSQKNVTQLRRSSKCCTLAPGDAQAQSEEQQGRMQSSSRAVTRGGTKSRSSSPGAAQHVAELSSPLPGECSALG